MLMSLSNHRRAGFVNHRLRLVEKRQNGLNMHVHIVLKQLLCLRFWVVVKQFAKAAVTAQMFPE